jgi:hypothetical protein
MTFKPQRYENIGYDHLVTFAVYSLAKVKKEITFEELVREVFESFPERFKLHVRGKHWPDSSLINKSWLRARTDRKWIVGNRASGFSLTPAGKKIAEQVTKQLKVQNRISQTKNSVGDQTKSTRVVKQVIESAAFRKYKGYRVDDITEYEFCDSIFSTLDTSPNIKQKNIELIRQHAKTLGEGRVLNYLDEIQLKFENSIALDNTRRKYRGGMMKRKM